MPPRLFMSELKQPSSRLRPWLLGLVGGVVILIAAAVYLQTRHGFRHVIVPVATAVAPGDLEVEDGYLRLRGTVALEGLSYVDLVAGTEIRAERLLLSVSPFSLLGDRLPVIHDLQVERARLALSIAPGDDSDEGDRGGAVAALPFLLERGRVEELDLSISAPEWTVTADDVAVAVEPRTDDERREITLSTAWRYLKEESKDTWAGSLDLVATVARGQGDDAVAWSGTNRIVLREAPVFTPPAREVVITQTTEGSYRPATGALTAMAATQASQEGTSIADTTLEIATAGRPEGRSTIASLVIDRVTAAALNLGLAGRAGARFETGQVTGRIDVEGLGEETRVRSSLKGDELRLRVQDARQTTPPLAIAVEQAATVDGLVRALTLDSLDATVSDRERALISAHLDQPLRIDLEATEPAEDAPPASTQPAVLSLRVNEVGVEDLRPWLSLTGNDPLTGIQRGTVQGLVRVLVQGQAEVVEMNGRMLVDRLTVEGPDAQRPAGPFRLEQVLRATLYKLETLELDEWETSLTSGQTAIGALRATGTMLVRPRVSVETLTARLTLDELEAEVLNPLLSQPGGTRIARARVSGTGRIEVTGQGAEWNADLRARSVRFLLPGSPDPTPPVEVVLAQTGRFDRDRSTLTLQRLRGQVLENGRAVLAGALDQPLTLTLAPAAVPRADLPGDMPPIHMTLKVTRLALDQVKPWLVLTGNRNLEAVAGGALDGRLGVTVRGQGETVTVEGYLDGSDVRLRTAAATLGPFALRSRVEATVAGASRLSLKLLLLRVLAGQKELVQLQASGSADTGSGALDLTTNVLSGDLAGALGRLGWMNERQPARVSGGELSASLRVQSAGGDRPVAMTGEAAARNLRVLVTDRKRVTKSLIAQVDVEVNAPRTALRVKRVGLTVQSGEGPAGRLAVAGTWPLAGARGGDRPSAPQAIPGEVVITSSQLDASPLLELFGLLPGRAPGPVLLIGETTVTRDPVSRRLRARGRSSIGPLAPSHGRAGPATATVDLAFDVSLDDHELMRVSRLDIASDRASGIGDDVHLTGLLRLGARPRLDLRGAINALDAGWYAGLVSAPEPEAASSGTARTAQPGSGADTGEEGVPFALPLDLDLDTTIGTITYETLSIGKGRIVGQGTGDRAQVTLEPTGFAGGSVQGTITVAVKGRRPDLAWSAKGSQIDLGALFQALDPARGPVVTGRASFTTSGTGRGEGTALKKSLTGTAAVEVVDGRFVRSELLAFIAEQTKIKEFENLGFQTLNGDLQLAEGWIQVSSLRARGPGVAVDATGKVSLDGELDLSVAPKVMGAVAERARRLCFGPLMTTVEDVTTFPFGVRVTGTIDNPKFGVTLTVADSLRQGIGGLPLRVLQTLKDCGNLPKAGRQLAEEGLNILKGASDALQGLFGTGGKPEKKP